MTIAYDPGDFNEITVLSRWRGTIMPVVLGKPAIWLLLIAHCTFLYMKLHPATDGLALPPLPGKIAKVPNSLLIFFVVFYSNNCYARYYTFYSKCTGMAGAVMCWVGLLRVCFPKATPEKYWNLCRHMIASVYVLYFQLAGGASDGGKLVTESEWSVLLQTGLLAPEEQRKLHEYRGFRPFLLQVWGLRAINDELASDQPKAAGAALGPFQAQAFGLRGNCADIVNTMTQPVPFPYYHTLTLMLSLNLLMTGYSMTEHETIMSIPIFFVVALICMGLKECAVALSDPFGGDDVDFETDVYMANMLANAKALISHTADYEKQMLPLPAVPRNAAKMGVPSI